MTGTEEQVGQEKPDRVEPGQVWLDNDVRTVHPEFEVTGLEEKDGATYAVVRRGGRTMRIRADRMLSLNHSRGYTYLGRGK